MRRKWFVRYPFTVDVFAKNGTSFDVLIDGKQSDIMFYNHNEDAEGCDPIPPLPAESGKSDRPLDRRPFGAYRRTA